MRQEGSPLDLNNLPEEYGGKQVVESSTTTATSSAHAVSKKKKSGGGKKADDAEKVYQCRFCSLKFGKSQALGGHMNRHRQERENETLNRARQLVFGNESLAAIGSPMSFRDVNMAAAAAAPPAVVGGNFRGGAAGGSSINDTCLVPFRPVHPRHSYHHYLYTPPSTTLHHPMSYPATYPGPPRQQPAVGDYVIGHAVDVSTGGDDALMQSPTHHGSSFSCFGAPLLLTAPPAVAAATNMQADKVNCNCSFGCGGHSRNNNNVNASST